MPNRFQEEQIDTDTEKAATTEELKLMMKMMCSERNDLARYSKSSKA